MTELDNRRIDINSFLKQNLNYIIVVGLMLFGAYLFKNTTPTTPVGFAFLYILCIIVQIVYLVKSAVSSSMRFGTLRAGTNVILFYLSSALPVYIIALALVVFDFFANTRIASNIISLPLLLIYAVPFRIKRRIVRQQKEVLYSPNITDEYGQAVSPPVIEEHDEYADVKRPRKQEINLNKESEVN